MSDRFNSPYLCGLKRVVPLWTAKTRYFLRGWFLRFMDSFSKKCLSMTQPQTPSTKTLGKRSEKSGYLSLHQIGDLVAHGVVSQHELLTKANNSRLYATDRDEFVDFHAWQSVNTNPSTEQGVRQ
jgi:hypothetical protein